MTGAFFMMTLTEEQVEALDDIGRWHRTSDKPYYYAAGYAGTGKTTMARELAGRVSGLVIFAAYTGKAAHVLRKKGCREAQTLHSLLYVVTTRGKEKLLALQAELTARVTEDPTTDVTKLLAEIREETKRVGKPSFQLNPQSPLQAASLLVIDECSMCDERIANDVLSFGVPVLALGDPAQLPPIYGTGFFTRSEPDFFLTQIQRQAEDDPIIRLATLAREGKTLPEGAWGASRVVKSPSFKREEMSLDAQVIVGRNATRRRANAYCRQRREFTGDLPVEGDRVVCLKNNREAGLLNGSMWRVEQVGPAVDEVFSMVLSGDDGEVLSVDAAEAPFRGEEVNRWDTDDVEVFDFGYCLTAHKAQGSEFPEVVVVDESSCFRQDASKHLYTAITRAQEKVTVVI